MISVDLKNGNGKITFGKEGTPDCTFVMLDEDFMKLVNRKLKPQEAFMQGKLKIKGNMAKAMKFNPSVFPADAKLWSTEFESVLNVQSLRNLPTSTKSYLVSFIPIS